MPLRGDDGQLLRRCDAATAMRKKGKIYKPEGASVRVMMHEITHDIIIICKEGTVNSYMSGLVVAINAKKNGEDVAVVFMQEGLIALAKRRFRWLPIIEEDADKIKENADKMGVPADPIKLVKRAKDAGVPLYACYAWVKLTKIQIPEGLEKIELKDLVKAMSRAKQVITL